MSAALRESPTAPEIAMQIPLAPWIPPAPKYRDRVNSHALYQSRNDLGLPDLLSETWVPERLVSFNDPARYGQDAALHFFIDDYRFEPIWQAPAKYAERFEMNGAVLTPDFSVYSDWPLAMQIWQVYRNRWVGAHLQSLGFRVIPTVGWASPADFFFEGLPQRSVVAIATTGVRRTPEGIDHFTVGFDRLAELDPLCVLVYGGLAGLIDDPGVPVREYPSFLDNRRSIMEGD
ncbi:MAG: DUF4417 domain-containing protein [Alphaproteobacteria bacterium]|nr:DUF4417 domain-containing protein [Alphaproteobacteria bacterium]